MSLSLPAPGWYPDPNDPSREMFWDGDEWVPPSLPAGTLPVQTPKPQAGIDSKTLAFVLGAIFLAAAGVAVVLGFNSNDTQEPQPLVSNFTDCNEANRAGVFDIPRDDPGYWAGGDRDRDGYACEAPES